MVKPSKLRVLLIAEACNPAWTSVPLVGYNVARALANRDDLDITLATHPRNSEDLEADSLSASARILYPDNEYVAKRAYDLAQRLRGNQGSGWTTNTAFQSFSYLFFERELYRELGELLEQGVFDIIHRVTPVTPTVGSPLACWTDTPMVLGPMNGGLPWPEAFPELRAKENEFLVPLRKLYKHFPYYHATYRNIQAAIAGSRHTASEIPRQFQGRRYLIPENGVDPNRFMHSQAWTPPRDRFRFITVGRLVPYKGLFLTLQAMRDSDVLRRSELVVIGDGPYRGEVERMVADFGLRDQVRLLGHQDQTTIAREMNQAQCFVFPSLREFGGGVVLEAMACHLPSVIVEYGGPLDLIDQTCGVLVPMQPEQELVADLRKAMETLAEDHRRCEALGSRAAQRVREEFTWAAKAEQLVQVYHDVLEIETCQTQESGHTSVTLASTS